MKRRRLALPTPTPETAPDVVMNELTCQQCEERLHELLDGSVSVSCPALDAHLVSCADCRGLFAAARQMQVRLRSLPAPIPPVDLTGRIVAGVLFDARRRRRLRVGLMIGAALAASLLLALVGSWAVLHGPVQKVIVDASQRAPEPPPPPAPKEPSLQENVADATSAVASLSRRTTDDALGGAQLLVPPLTIPTPDDLTPPLDPPAQALIDTGHGASVSLQPVTNSAKRAFGLFVRDLPPLNPQEKSGL
jgi:hypothetical protein